MKNSHGAYSLTFSELLGKPQSSEGGVCTQTICSCSIRLKLKKIFFLTNLWLVPFEVNVEKLPIVFFLIHQNSCV
jgi:hypothetical protein